MEFSERLDSFLAEKGISNYKMAADTGISDSLIGYWRKGKRKPTLDNIITVANYLEVSIDYLLKGCDAAKSPPPHLTKSELALFNLIHPLSENEQIKITGMIELILMAKYPLPDLPEPLDLRGVQVSRVFKDTTQKPQ